MSDNEPKLTLSALAESIPTMAPVDISSADVGLGGVGGDLIRAAGEKRSRPMDTMGDLDEEMRPQSGLLGRRKRGRIGSDDEAYIEEEDDEDDDYEDEAYVPSKRAARAADNAVVPVAVQGGVVKGKMKAAERRRVDDFVNQVTEGTLKVPRGGLARAMHEYVNPHRTREFFEKLVSRLKLNTKLAQHLTARVPRRERREAAAASAMASLETPSTKPGMHTSRNSGATPLEDTRAHMHTQMYGAQPQPHAHSQSHLPSGGQLNFSGGDMGSGLPSNAHTLPMPPPPSSMLPPFGLAQYGLLPPPPPLPPTSTPLPPTSGPPTTSQPLHPSMLFPHLPPPQFPPIFPPSEQHQSSPSPPQPQQQQQQQEHAVVFAIHPSTGQLFPCVISRSQLNATPMMQHSPPPPPTQHFHTPPQPFFFPPHQQPPTSK